MRPVIMNLLNQDQSQQIGSTPIEVRVLCLPSNTLLGQEGLSTEELLSLQQAHPLKTKVQHQAPLHEGRR